MRAVRRTPVSATQCSVKSKRRLWYGTRACPLAGDVSRGCDDIASRNLRTPSRARPRWFPRSESPLGESFSGNDPQVACGTMKVEAHVLLRRGQPTSYDARLVQRACAVRRVHVGLPVQTKQCGLASAEQLLPVSYDTLGCTWEQPQTSKRTRRRRGARRSKDITRPRSIIVYCFCSKRCA